MASNFHLYLNQMGIQLWKLRHPQLTKAPSADNHCNLQISQPPLNPASNLELIAPDLEPVTDHANTPVERLDWADLATRVQGCTACELHTKRKQAVFGVGNRSAQWLIVGEAPGADEDRLGEPFVGRSGQLLDRMLFALGLSRDQVFIANIVKCRPPQNRDPLPEEASSCRPFLARQIALIKPQILLAVGRIAAQNLLQTDLAVGRLRGRVHRFGAADIPLVVTYHPAYLLRSPREKRKTWDDLQLARRSLLAATSTNPT